MLELKQGPATPLEFVQTLDGSSHVVLFNENKLHAAKVIAKFLEIGIRKGDQCILAGTSNPSRVESQLPKIGTNAKMKNYGGMRFEKLADLGTIRGADQRERLLEESRNSDHNLRIVINQPAPANKSSIRRHIELEREVQSGLESAIHHSPNAKKIVLCSLAVSEIKPPIHYGWMIDILKIHNSAIFTPSLSDGIGFWMR